jgi:hypothetical protein
MLTFWNTVCSIFIGGYRDGTECYKTLTYKIQTLVSHPERSILHSEHGKSLKSRTKLSTTCYVSRFIKPLTSHKTLLLIYLSILHSHELWNIILGELSNGIVMGCGNRDCCRDLLKKLKILLLMSQCILSLLILVVNNIDQFLINSGIQNINTRHNLHPHLPSANLDIYQRGFTIQVLRL